MKSPYLKPNSGGGKHRGNYAKYIATREGVEIAEDTSKHLHATVKQEDLIRQLLRDFPDSTDFHEYGDYKRSPTRENATELIDRVMETHSGEMASRERYVSYIAERPGVESWASTAYLQTRVSQLFWNRYQEKWRRARAISGPISSLCTGRMLPGWVMTPLRTG